MSSLSPWLMSEETGEPFRHCIHCRLPLAEVDAPWLVTKDYRQGECMLEYAICQPCRNEVVDGFSEESKEAVRNFLEHEIDWAARVAEFMMMHSVEQRLEHCISCRSPRNTAGGFVLSAQFDSDGHLIEGPLPVMLCDQCSARLVSTLPDSHREVWQGFLTSHFEGPPDDDDGGYLGIF